MSQKEIYPRVNLNGKCFANLGKMGDEIKITLTGKIVSTREDEYGNDVGLDVYGVSSDGKETKVVATAINEADTVLEKLSAGPSY